MVQKPFYNEAGFENEEVGGGYVNESALYSERAFVMARGFVRFALTRPPIGVEDVLAWLYLPIFTSEGKMQVVEHEQDERLQLLQKVVERGQKLIDASEAYRIKTRENSDSLDDTERQSGSRDDCAAAAVNTLMDGAGYTIDAIKTFLRPLSKGAVVMLTRQLQELNGCLEELRGRCGKVKEDEGVS